MAREVAWRTEVAERECRFGEACTRTRPDHFDEYSHPPGVRERNAALGAGAAHPRGNAMMGSARASGGGGGSGGGSGRGGGGGSGESSGRGGGGGRGSGRGGGGGGGDGRGAVGRGGLRQTTLPFARLPARAPPDVVARDVMARDVSMAPPDVTMAPPPLPPSPPPPPVSAAPQPVPPRSDAADGSGRDAAAVLATDAVMDDILDSNVDMAVSSAAAAAAAGDSTDDVDAGRCDAAAPPPPRPLSARLRACALCRGVDAAVWGYCGVWITRTGVSPGVSSLDEGAPAPWDASLVRLPYGAGVGAARWRRLTRVLRSADVRSVDDFEVIDWLRRLSRDARVRVCVCVAAAQGLVSACAGHRVQCSLLRSMAAGREHGPAVQEFVSSSLAAVVDVRGARAARGGRSRDACGALT